MSDGWIMFWLLLFITLLCPVLGMALLGLLMCVSLTVYIYFGIGHTTSMRRKK